MTLSVKSRTLKEFEYVLDQMGYKYQLSESLKYWTVVPKGWKKPIRLYRLGEDYTNDRIKERIKGNRDKVYLEPYQKQTYKPRQYRLATREHRIKKRRAVCTVCIFTIATNLAICQTTKSRTLLDCIIFSEKICIRSISYLHKSGCSVEKTSQLLSNFFLYKSKAMGEIKTLTAYRTHLRNEIRKVNIDDDSLSTAKLKISAISEKLSELRKDVRLCDAIAERSDAMKENLEAVLADEEKN